MAVRGVLSFRYLEIHFLKNFMLVRENSRWGIGLQYNLSAARLNSHACVASFLATQRLWDEDGGVERHRYKGNDGMNCTPCSATIAKIDVYFFGSSIAKWWTLFRSGLYSTVLNFSEKILQ